MSMTVPQIEKKIARLVRQAHEAQKEAKRHHGNPGKIQACLTERWKALTSAAQWREILAAHKGFKSAREMFDAEVK